MKLFFGEYVGLRIVAISDTHEMHEKISVPEGDVLVHAGDATSHGTESAILKFNQWLGTLPHRHKIFVAGNHDFGFERQPGLFQSLLTNAKYLQDTCTLIEGYWFYGSSWQPEFCNWAFNLPRGPALAAKWALIPPATDVLITHGPPHGILDMNPIDQHVGCEDLMARVNKINPKMHIFGHIHRGHGMAKYGRTTFINASICDESYHPVQCPLVFDLK